jgi:carbohydrate kinase (thermoresistant glucokinase family)
LLRRSGIAAVLRSSMPAIPGLRSPYARVGRLVYFGRMLDKIRLHAAGALPPDYVANFGDTKPTVFDGRICRFLRVAHAELQARVLAHPEASDADHLAWAEERGGRRNDEECEIFCAFLSKRGWRDQGRPLLEQRIAESGLQGRPIETMFDYLDFDEGRDPVAARAWEVKPLVIVVMGVSGAGKSAHGRALAAALGWDFADADDFHPPANIARMAAGQPLDDTDRAPWLAALRARIEQALAAERPLVLACSALKQAYRDALWADRPRMRLVYLEGSRDLLAARLAARAGHFMPPALLDSQLATLEAPSDAIRIDISATPGDQVAAVRAALGL